jgi:hypothetical protein
MQLEQQIYSIEAANINHETLQAMRSAGDAMKTIHNGMTLEQVDNTMYVMSVRGRREQKTRVIWERMCLLMTALQGNTPRTTNDQPGNWRRYYDHATGRADGRGRPRGRARGTGAGGDGRAHAQHWAYASGNSVGGSTRCWKYRA